MCFTRDHCFVRRVSVRVKWPSSCARSFSGRNAFRCVWTGLLLRLFCGVIDFPLPFFFLRCCNLTRIDSSERDRECYIDVGRWRKWLVSFSSSFICLFFLPVVYIGCTWKKKKKQKQKRPRGCCAVKMDFKCWTKCKVPCVTVIIRPYYFPNSAKT